jgi:hypothetical protein
VFAFACAGWGTLAYWRGLAVSSDYRGLLVVAELLVAVQGLTGLAMLAAGEQPPRLVHILYGGLAIVAWPVVYVAGASWNERRKPGAHALAAWLVLLMALRAGAMN